MNQIGKIAILGGMALLFAHPANAELVKQDANGFVVRHEVEVVSNEDDTYDMLRAPAKWWSGEHSWTGNAENFYMDAQATGCFCELIPAKREGGPRGSVEHMRIVFADPGKTLRLVGALGPLQGEAIQGSMTISLTPTDNGTSVKFEYVVGGYMRFPIEVIGPAVDGVIGEQASRLADVLGLVEVAPELEAGAATESDSVPEDENDLDEKAAKPDEDDDSAVESDE